MESASADDVRARGSPKGLVLAPLQAQAQHYPKGEGWKRSQFGSRKRSQTDRQTDAPTTTTLIASGPPLRGDPYFVCISTTLLRNNIADFLSVFRSACRVLTVVVAIHVLVLLWSFVFKPCQSPMLFWLCAGFFVIVARGFLTMPFFHTFL